MRVPLAGLAFTLSPRQLIAMDEPQAGNRGFSPQPVSTLEAELDWARASWRATPITLPAACVHTCKYIQTCTTAETAERIGRAAAQLPAVDGGSPPAAAAAAVAAAAASCFSCRCCCFWSCSAFASKLSDRSTSCSAPRIMAFHFCSSSASRPQGRASSGYSREHSSHLHDGIPLRQQRLRKHRQAAQAVQGRAPPSEGGTPAADQSHFLRLLKVRIESLPACSARQAACCSMAWGKDCQEIWAAPELTCTLAVQAG